MGRFLAILGLLLAFADPAAALPAPRVAVLSGSPCRGAAVKIDFTAGVYCLNGVRVGNFLSLPGATYSGSVSGTGATVRTALNSAGQVVNFANGVPRVTDLGLLDELAATNIVFPSIVPGVPPGGNSWNAAWSGGANVYTANAMAGPDGSATATKVVTGANTLDGPYYRSTTLPAANSVWTVSAWLYSVAGGSVWLGIADTPSNTAWTGTSQAKFAIPSGQWTRVQFSRTALGVVTATSVTPIFIADLAGQTFYIWGVQLEVGAAASSYIPTTSAAVTRSADAASLTYSPNGSAATVLYGTSSSASVSPTSPINLGASSGGAWIGGYVRRLTVLP
jgi:hypothetical protein